MLVSYRLWHLQDEVTGQSAMKYLDFKDIDFLKDGRRRLEEFRFLMRKIDTAAQEEGLLKQKMTAIDCTEAFKGAIGKLDVPKVTPTGRKRHLERILWTSFVQMLPARKRGGNV
jgi:hypothetical protein